MINTTYYSNGNQILQDLQSQPELQELLSDRERITVSIYRSIKDGMEAEHGQCCSCPVYCGNFHHINVTRMSAPKQRGAVCFEFTNVLASEETSKIDFNLRCKKYKTAEAYARAQEELEFRGVVQTLEIEKQINTRLGIKWMDSGFSNIPQRVIEERDFETYYNHHLDESHKDFYRRRWHKRMNIPYESSCYRWTSVALTAISFIGLLLSIQALDLRRIKFL